MVFCLLTFLFCVTALAVAHADSPGEPPLPMVTIAELTGLLGSSELPELFAGFSDMNPDDQYAAGIDILSGSAKLQLSGRDPIEVSLQLFLREGVIGAVQVQQDSVSHAATRDPLELYQQVVEQLLSSAVKPDGKPSLGQGTAGWAFGEAGWLESSRGYDSQGLFFYALTGPLRDSFGEFWQNWNAMIDEQAAGFMFF